MAATVVASNARPWTRPEADEMRAYMRWIAGARELSIMVPNLACIASMPACMVRAMRLFSGASPIAVSWLDLRSIHKVCAKNQWLRKIEDILANGFLFSQQCLPAGAYAYFSSARFPLFPIFSEQISQAAFKCF